MSASEAQAPGLAGMGGVPDADRFLRGLVQGVRCGIVAIDADRQLVLLNEHARRILELPETPPAGAPIWQALARHPALVQVLSESFHMSSLPNRAELELGSGQGGKTIGFTLSMVRTGGGDACGAAMFFKDLTRIEHTEEQERLKDRLAALGQMAASMAHEIRNPLASIDVTCKLLSRRLGEASDCRELLDRITSEVKRLEATISSSLEFVRPLRPTFVRGDIVPLLEEAIGIAEGRRGKPGIVLRRRFSGGIPPFLMDPGLMRQVFVNLLLNAMEACGEGGTVTVEAEAVEAPDETTVPYRPAEPSDNDPLRDVRQFVVVRVGDTGPGIDEAQRDRIFYPFFTTKKQGSGVGLAMAKKVVVSHRGLIDVESARGEGAEFLVRLPLVTKQAEV